MPENANILGLLTSEILLLEFGLSAFYMLHFLFKPVVKFLSNELFLFSEIISRCNESLVPVLLTVYLSGTFRRYRYPARNRRPLRLGTYAELESLTAGGPGGEAAQLCDIESEEADSGL